MKISIITIVYNNERTIEEAINSVLSQLYYDVEYIVIDGKSIDNTISLVRKYQDKIALIISESDEGIYDAMNKGIQLATGDVIAILNSDDLYQDINVISDVMMEFEKDPELDILYGNLVYVKSENTSKVIRQWKSSTYYDNFFENGNVPPHPALFVKRNVYEKAGVFNLEYKLAADYEFMLRVFKKHSFKTKYINRLMVRMRLGGATNKSISNIINGNREILKSWKANNLQAPFYLMPVRLFKRLIQFT